jgi:L-seryl-tRNA(Ser) seleniumtransferase
MKQAGKAPSGLTRRSLFRALAGASGVLAAKTGTSAGSPSGDNIYTRLLGVRPLLSVRGHTTLIGGCRMPAEVLRAMAEANDYFVDLHELNAAAGKRIAEVMKAEAAMVTAGSFSAMILGAAACLTGTDRSRVDALPHPTWVKRECLTQKAHRFDYDRAYRAAGMTMVDVETREQLINAIGDRTAMLAVLASVERNSKPGVLLPQEFVEIGRKAGVPVLIDAASELPPESVLTRYTTIGADLVVVSGGKGLEGPQSTGILAGRKDLIEAASLNHSPNTAIGRGMKVGKEEIIGVITALNRYLRLDHEIVQEGWNKRARYLAEQLQGISGLNAEYRINAYGFGEIRIGWDRAKIPLSGKQAAERLKNGQPRIGYYDDDEGGVLQTRTMVEGEEILAGRRLRQFFMDETRA